MWSPADMMALPSPEETRRTIEVIKKLEIELQEAVEAFERAKSRILSLERDLEERRGWIAPIRKIPVEILTKVFLLASETDRLAPLKLAGVCHLWREIMITTPRAWSFIHLAKSGDFSRSDVYLSTFLERSHPRLLHLSVPETPNDSTHMINSILVKFLHRIECLTISPSQLESLNHLTTTRDDIIPFPHLRRLSLLADQYHNDADTSFFDVSRFPALEFLHWPRYRCYGPQPTFAHVQHLSVQVDEWDAWLDVVESCAATLKSLDVLCTLTSDDELQLESRIELPLLQSLRLDTDAEINCKFITPALISVSITLGPFLRPMPFEADIDKVIHLRWEDYAKYSIPAGYMAVRCLQLYYPFWCKSVDDTPKYAESLKAAASALPSLEVIEVNTKGCRIPDWDLIMYKTSEKLNETGVTARLMWANGWIQALPGYLNTPCGPGMPCFSPETM